MKIKSLCSRVYSSVSPLSRLSVSHLTPFRVSPSKSVSLLAPALLSPPSLPPPHTEGHSNKELSQDRAANCSAALSLVSDPNKGTSPFWGFFLFFFFLSFPSSSPSSPLFHHVKYNLRISRVGCHNLTPASVASQDRGAR